MPTAYIRVTLKNGLFDAQGAAVQKGLQQLGHDFVQNVSIGKYITVQMDDTHSPQELDARLDQMCRQLLANPVIEEYEVRLSNDELETAPAAAAATTTAATAQRSASEPLSYDYSMYRALPAEEQLNLLIQALLKHGQWISQQLDELNANWILVVGGQVVDSGESLETYPSEERLKELGNANNLVPWVFTRPSH